MTTWEIVRLLGSIGLIVWLSVDLKTCDKWRALNGFLLALNMVTVWNILVKHWK